MDKSVMYLARVLPVAKEEQILKVRVRSSTERYLSSVSASAEVTVNWVPTIQLAVCTSHRKHAFPKLQPPFGCKTNTSVFEE